MQRRIIVSAVAILFASAGCTKNFESINTDPTKSSEANLDPNYLMTAGELSFANVSEYQLYELGAMTQVLSSTTDYYGGGDKYSPQLFSYNTRFFSEGMVTAGTLLEAQTIAAKRPADTYDNLLQMSRILWVMTMQRVTDIYGDIPYFQAGKATQGIQYPVYDKQQDIYKDMLTQLDDAISKLDASKPLPTGDIYYSGDITKWKKFGYSLMLRVAMRLVKVDPVTAQQYAEKAAAGGTLASNSDNALVKFDAGGGVTYNSSNALLGDLPNVRWSKTFIDYMNTFNDPRLYVLAEKPDTGLLNNTDLFKAGLAYTKTNPAPAGSVNESPVGMPNGYDIGGARGITTSPNYPGPTGTGSNAAVQGPFARPKIAVFTNKYLPAFVLTYAETELMLAEAKERGWNVGGTTAAAHYANGVTGAMNQLALWNSTNTVATGDISAFLMAHPLDETSLASALNGINTQYWVATIFDFAENFSNYRRSGYPVLTPVAYPGNVTNGTIPRRITYPLTENANNTVNYQDALQRMGGTDVPTARVWWDVNK
jgi:hypothetical protein